MLDGCYKLLEEWRKISDKAIKTESGKIIPLSQCGIHDGGIYIRLWILREKNLPILGEAIEFSELQNIYEYIFEIQEERVHKPKHIEPVYGQEALSELLFY